MRQTHDSALGATLARWNRTKARARTATDAVNVEQESPAAKEQRRAQRVTGPLQPTPRGNPEAMSRTRARHLAFTLARYEPDYKAYEVRRTDLVYDLAVVDTWAGHSFVVTTPRQLAQLLTHLHDPSLLLDAQSGTIFVKTPFYEDIYNAEEDYSDLKHYTLIAHFDPRDRSGAVDVTIEPRPEPSSDIGRMFHTAEQCIGSACSQALEQGARERSLVLAEAGRRLRLYLDACA